MRKFKKSERGVLTVQFLIVIVLVLFFVVSFFGLTMTLAYSSLTQYLTYASARKMSLGGPLGRDQQEDVGKLKYRTVRDGIFGSSFLGGDEWFIIPQDAQVGFNTDYGSQEDGMPGARKLFYGSFVSFQSNISNFTVPFLTDKTDEDLDTTVGSYLGREPSVEECENFFSTTPSLFPASEYNGVSFSPTELFGDNGC